MERSGGKIIVHIRVPKDDSIQDEIKVGNVIEIKPRLIFKNGYVGLKPYISRVIDEQTN